VAGRHAGRGRRAPDIAGVVRFSHVDNARGVDWGIETEPAAVSAWRAGFTARLVVPAPPG
jgi:hypothetical protein